MIDVNPRFRDADWLRNYVVNLYKRESLRQDFPSGVWDLKRTVGASVRVVYSLADIDSVYVVSITPIFPLYPIFLP